MEFSRSFPILWAYGNIVQEYNIRQFTHEEDILFALAGITTALSRTFAGGFICGLPLLFLDAGLCWQPMGNCNRRMPSERKEPTELGLPSWSWAGWKCRLDPSAWDMGTDDYVKQSFRNNDKGRQQMHSIVEWHCRKWGTTEKKPIHGPQSRIQELKADAARKDSRTPAGWTRFDYDIDLNWLRDKYPTTGTFREESTWALNLSSLSPDPGMLPPPYFYKNDHDLHSEFWYPIPTCYDSKRKYSLYSQELNNETLLCGRTQRTWLALSNRVTCEDGFQTVSIVDEKENWIGALRLQMSLSPTQDLATCEVVAILAGYAVEGYRISSIDEWDSEERPKKREGEKYEYYNVLWVEWRDGIAYRKALGHVMKEAWEAQPLEWIDLVLG